MKQRSLSILKYFTSDELPFNERILNFVCFLGALATVAAFIARIIEGVPFITLSTMIFMFIAVFCVFFLSAMRVKYISLLTTIVAYGLGLVFFPIVFFTNGGASSGMAAYFTLVIIIDFLLLKGAARVAALILTSAVMIFCYASTLFFGWKVLPDGGLNVTQQFIDDIQSVLVSGFFIGAVIVFQNGVYLREKNKAEAASEEIRRNEELLKLSMRQLNERLVQQQLMSDISKSFITKEPMDSQIRNALARMGQFLNVARVLIAVFEKNSESSRPEYFWVADPKYTPDISQKGFSKIIRELFPRYRGETDENQAIYCDNTLAYESGKFKLFHELGGLKSFICAPIYVDGELWGVMSIEEHGRFRSWNESDAMLVSTVSSAISSAVARDIIDTERSAALEQALQASHAKSDFLSNMSHEMRTPMNAIIGMTVIGKTSDTIEKKDYAFEKIDNASKHLLGVINDILDMSKIEANKLELSPASFNFEMMIQKVVNVINFRIEERRQQFYINIDNKIPQILVGDDQRLSQVITNLLSNAVKFTPEEGTIHLDARFVSGEENKCRIEISVTDTGIGITDEQKARLFNSFEQADVGTSRKYGGTGLGLAISKRIIELMEGKIWVESEPGRGTRFTFSVDLQRGSREHIRQLPEGIDWSNLRIFAVDDDSEIRRLFADFSANLGIFCTVASTAEEARELLLHDDNYDVFFLDWKLPGMNGIEMTRFLREKTALKSIVILFSSVDWGIIKDDARKAGVDKFLPKPLFQSSIVDILNECIGVVEPAKHVTVNESNANFSGHTILLAEDVDINREIVIELLQPTHLTIECAENGAQALRMFEKEPDKYDMIFMDLQMPEMDGYEATRRIRSFEAGSSLKTQGKAFRRVPIIAMTANVFREDIERCLEAGMNSHIGKPLDFDNVLDKLRIYLPHGKAVLSHG